MHSAFLQSLLTLLLNYWPLLLGLVALILGVIYRKVLNRILDWIDKLLN